MSLAGQIEAHLLREKMRALGKAARAAAAALAKQEPEAKNAALAAAATAIRSDSCAILDANAADMERARGRGVKGAFLDRLALDDSRVEAMAQGLDAVAGLPDPVGACMDEWTRPNGLAIRRVRVPLPGAHLLPNVLAAAAAGLADGVPFADAADAIEALDVPLRLTVRCLGGGVTLLDDTYNASPAATLAALDLLGEMAADGRGRRIALLGDMLELGPLAESAHEQVGRRAAARADALYAVGELGAAIARAASAAGLAAVRRFETKEDAAAALRETLRPGDALLVKGSRALALETLVAELEAAAAGKDAP